MANRLRGPRRALRRGRGFQARPILAAERRYGAGPRRRAWLGWLAVAASITVVAFIAGRVGLELDLPSPSPSPSEAAPLPIAFGTALDAASGEATQLTQRFRAGDRIAYSVRLDAAPGVDTILVEIVRLEGEAETVVQAPAEQGIVATSRVIAFTFAVQTGELLAAWGPGSYAMKIYLGAADPVAVGRFTLVETPTES